MERREVLDKTADKISELAESIRDDMDVSTAEDVYATILVCLLRQFKSILSPTELAYHLNYVAALVLENSSDEDKSMRAMYPRMPDGFRPTDN